MSFNAASGDVILNRIGVWGEYHKQKKAVSIMLTAINIFNRCIKMLAAHGSKLTALLRRI
jgi:hypothetical protein